MLESNQFNNSCKQTKLLTISEQDLTIVTRGQVLSLVHVLLHNISAHFSVNPAVLGKLQQ